jgi:hypothetical protein
MAVIWGLDLREMQWNKFGSSYMVNIPRYTVDVLLQGTFRTLHLGGIFDVSCIGKDLFYPSVPLPRSPPNAMH